MTRSLRWFGADGGVNTAAVMRLYFFPSGGALHLKLAGPVHAANARNALISPTP